ncbi:hypothetical protein QYE76_003809 [Lolium multiflorum]|uniref:DUF6598 domain-containing protein n=1 Tax=Lolium multiflorum TaxID=4521 RepID=A0AAD8W0T6_LOLMU|nr:hypothetical protein QYE76_003809 [Lolium multiflorum]
MEMEMEETWRKRERLAETDGAREKQAREKKVSGKISAASQAVSFHGQARDPLSKLLEDLRLEQAVARRNKENSGGDPIVAEDLTEHERTELLLEAKAREMRAERELSERLYAELLAAEAEVARAPPPDLNQEDRSELDYSEYRRNWNDKWSSQYGSFEDTTPIPCMRFTDNPMPHLTCNPSTVQIFSVKIAEIAGGLQCPLDVFGTIAMRDSLDHNRNIIFCRTRDNCQSLTQQDRNLVLTGPVRAVVHKYGSVYIDAVLKVKGSSESEDKDLSLLIRRCNRYEPLESIVSSICYSSKLSTLELAYGIVVSSVEATITVRVIEGSWPAGFRGQFTAGTASLPQMEVLLLDSGEEKVAAADGMVELSRRVVSVERLGQLMVSALLLRGGDKVAEAKTFFKPLEAGRNRGELDVGLCKMQVTVAWSPFLKGYPMRGFSPAMD